MKLSLILEAIDRMTGPSRKAAAGVKKIGEGAKPAAKALDDMDRKIRRVSASTFKWARMALRGAASVDRLVDRARALGRAARLGVRWVGIQALGLAARGAAKGIGFAASKLKDLVGWGAKWVSIGVSAVGSYLTYDMFAIASKFESVTAELERFEGSAAKAKAGMAWVRQFSRDAELPLEDLADTFVKARKAGLDPMAGSFQAIIDKAAESGEAIDDIVEAMKKAKTGSFGGLESLGIVAGRSKGNATFTYLDKEGKRAVRTVRDNARDVEKALSEIFVAQSAKAAGAQRGTFGSLVLQLKNMVASFQLDVADAGIFDLIKSKMQRFMDWIKGKTADGSLQRWAKEVSDRMEMVVEWIEKMTASALEFGKDIDWQGVASGIGAIASAAASAAAWIGRASTSLREWRYQSARRALENSVNGWFVSDEQRGRARQQIDALDVEYGKKRLPTYAGPQLRSAVRGAPKPASNADAWTRALKSKPTMAPPIARPGLGARVPAKSVPTGKISIDIKTEPGTTARPTKVAASGVNLEVNTGRSMGAFA